MQLDLGGMLAALEKQQHAPHAKPSSRPVVFSGRHLCTSARAQSCFPRLFSISFLVEVLITTAEGAGIAMDMDGEGE